MNAVHLVVFKYSVRNICFIFYVPVMKPSPFVHVRAYSTSVLFARFLILFKLVVIRTLVNNHGCFFVNVTPECRKQVVPFHLERTT